jgi:hypothetical protein
LPRLCQFIQPAEDQYGPAVVLHRFERLECDRLINLRCPEVRQKGVTDTCAQIVFNHAEWRIGNHNVKLPLRCPCSRIVCRDAESLISQRLRPLGIEFICVNILRICRNQKRAIACRRLINSRILVNAGEPRREVGQRDGSRVRLICHARRRPNVQGGLSIIQVNESVISRLRIAAILLDDLSRREHDAKLNGFVYLFGLSRCWPDLFTEEFGRDLASFRNRGEGASLTEDAGEVIGEVARVDNYVAEKAVASSSRVIEDGYSLVKIAEIQNIDLGYVRSLIYSRRLHSVLLNRRWLRSCT